MLAYLLIIAISILFTPHAMAVLTINDTGLPATATTTGLTDDPNASPSLAQAIGSVIGAILSLTGVIFLVIIVWGGNMWMTAKGNEQQVEQAKNLITNAVIGIIIIIGSYALTYFLVDVLSNAAVFDAA